MRPAGWSELLPAISTLFPRKSVDLINLLNAKQLNESILNYKSHANKITTIAPRNANNPQLLNRSALFVEAVPVLDELLVVLAPAPIVVLVTDTCIKILGLNIKIGCDIDTHGGRHGAKKLL